MNNSPWAKLTTSIMPKIRVSPEATRARIMPVTTPLSVWITIWSNGPLRRNSTLHAQISVNDGVVDLELGGWSVTPHHSLFGNVDPLRGFEGQRHILLDEQHGDAVAMQHVDDFPDLRDHPRHQPLGRLVQEDDLGLQHHCPGNREHLLLTTRKR